MQADPAVTGISRGVDVTTTINAVPVEGLAGGSVRGGLLFSAVAGHLPRGPGEVALGAATLRRVGPASAIPCGSPCPRRAAIRGPRRSAWWVWCPSR